MRQNSEANDLSPVFDAIVRKAERMPRAEIVRKIRAENARAVLASNRNDDDAADVAEIKKRAWQWALQSRTDSAR